MIKSRNTNQKRLILETINNLCHPTCDEIYHEVSKIDSSVGRATVFRNVKHLTNEGLLTQIVVPNGGLRYDNKVQDHSHFVCEKCGKLYDIAYLPNIDTPHSLEHEVKDYKLIFTGICKDCKEKERK